MSLFIRLDLFLEGEGKSAVIKISFFYDRTLEEMLGESCFGFCNGFRDTQWRHSAFGGAFV